MQHFYALCSNGNRRLAVPLSDELLTAVYLACDRT